MFWIVCSTFIWVLFCFGVFYFSDNKEYNVIAKFILIMVLLRDIAATLFYFFA